jgi:hypothetical protein
MLQKERISIIAGITLASAINWRSFSGRAAEMPLRILEAKDIAASSPEKMRSTSSLRQDVAISLAVSGVIDKHLRVLAAAFLVSKLAPWRSDINSTTESGARMLSATER